MQSGSISGFISAYCGLAHDAVVFSTCWNLVNEDIFIDDQDVFVSRQVIPSWRIV